MCVIRCRHATPDESPVRPKEPEPAPRVQVSREAWWREAIADSLRLLAIVHLKHYLQFNRARPRSR
jgi:hypothetical protein